MQNSHAPTAMRSRPVWPGAAAIALVGIALLALVLAGCKAEFSGFNCKRSGNVLQVGTNGSCKFRYSHGDIAKYVVIVTRAPTYGQAKGQGAYLHYVAKPGFVGEDRLTIKVERRGVGHVQWETRNITVKVGSDA
jgi:hypothetical protein